LIEAYFNSLQGISRRIVYEWTNMAACSYGSRTGRLRRQAGPLDTGTDEIDHPRELDGRMVEWPGDGGSQAKYSTWATLVSAVTDT
jgi:hypothetical protein